MKKCPFCAEDIQSDAIKCKHCGEWIKGKDDTKLSENKISTAAPASPSGTSFGLAGSSRFR